LQESTILNETLLGRYFDKVEGNANRLRT